jgi:hypothetical protein
MRHASIVAQGRFDEIKDTIMQELN